ncbi:hypothetical protein BGY98DRAFT_1125061 [Russula aff. rugulosa BPL654]|nr:hypothetical protein BGY98DRAFT_1125061 [Russula aff. rugulosa BPL654]
MLLLGLASSAFFCTFVPQVPQVVSQRQAHPAHARSDLSCKSPPGHAAHASSIKIIKLAPHVRSSDVAYATRLVSASANSNIAGNMAFMLWNCCPRRFCHLARSTFLTSTTRVSQSRTNININNSTSSATLRVQKPEESSRQLHDRRQRQTMECLPRYPDYAPRHRKMDDDDDNLPPIHRPVGVGVDMSSVAAEPVTAPSV